MELDSFEFPPEFYLINLINSQNPFLNTGFNAPGGGWGLRDRYETNTLDTANAIAALGKFTNPGLVIASQEITVGSFQNFRVRIPQDATDLRVLASTATASIRVRFSRSTIPTSSDPFFTIPSGITQTNLSLNESSPGQLWVQIEGTTTGSYGLEVAFATSNYPDNTSWSRALKYLVETQNPDGGWGISTGEPSSIFLTARTLAALDCARDHFQSNSLGLQGSNYLINNSNPDGSFGAETNKVSTTADAYQALMAWQPTSGASSAALSFLLNAQNSAGHWNNDPYQTSKAIMALEHSTRTTNSDGDAIPDLFDNCPNISNPDQSDADENGIGDACESDTDGDGLPDSTELAIGTNPGIEDSIVSGISDGDLDFSLDGRSNRQAVLDGDDPLVPRLSLVRGLNFFTYPVDTTSNFSARDLLAELGGSGSVNRILKYDPTTGQYLEAKYLSNGNPTGPDFPISGGDGMMIEMTSDLSRTFPGNVTYSIPDLHGGPNLRRFPYLTPTDTTLDLFLNLKTEARPASIQRLDTGTEKLTSFSVQNNSPSTPDFAVQPSETYLVHLDWVRPRFVITSPAPNQTISTTTTTITGEVGAEVQTVQINGVVANINNGTFTASNISLQPGSNLIEAIALTANPDVFSTLSFNINQGAAPDFILTAGGASASDFLDITGNAADFSQITSYSTTLSGAPVGLTFTDNGASFTGQDSIRLNFSLQANSSTPTGDYNLTLTVTLFDSSNNPITNVSGNVGNYLVTISP
ncbi:MAG: thrombospondin type 3 repeat-containing protein [Verrucomicrobiota bacterium]